ncbi:MAG: hypothetical protein ACOX4O_03535 [Eubacteriales bacterium]|jgi:hypothetical protein
MSVSDNVVLTVPREEIVIPQALTDSLKEQCGEDEDLLAELSVLIDKAAEIAVPKGIYAMLPVEFSDDCVMIDGKKSDNPLLLKQLRGCGRCFPAIATAGVELVSWADNEIKDPLEAYLIDRLMNAYVGIASAYVRKKILEEYRIEGHFNYMSPGSLAVWPLSGQTYLFSLFGEDAVRESVGVTLTDSMLMLPRKSGSSIGFESDRDFKSCMYCPRVDCSSRRAEYAAGVEI